MKNNPICEVLGIEYPVFQGGMAWVSDADLAGAGNHSCGKCSEGLGCRADSQGQTDYRQTFCGEYHVA